MNRKNIPIILSITIISILIFIPRSSDHVNSFDECVAAGNPVMKSYPRQCRSEGILFVEDISIKCEPGQRDVDACIEIYQPVCATVNVVCITEPCDPVEQTFPNSCKACTNSLVELYTPGECAGDRI